MIIYLVLLQDILNEVAWVNPSRQKNSSIFRNAGLIAHDDMLGRQTL